MEVIGVVLTKTVIPLIVVVCFVVVFVTLGKAMRIRTKMSLRYFQYAIGSFVFSLALPFLAFPFRLAFDVLAGPATDGILLAISATAIISGTYFLVMGTRQLRSETDAV
jgi:hypothetical protein